MTSEFSYLPDAPVGRLYYETSAALAEGRIPSGCPHPEAAGILRLHQRAVLCADCGKATWADPGPGECAACGAPDGSQWLNWLDTPARVVVAARICPRCLRTGNRSMAMN